MAELPVICDLCNSNVNTQFNPGSGLRQHEIITSTLLVDGPCFVRDIIEFKDSGELVFRPLNGKEYFSEYAVICRKLIINGGSKPISVTPCNPGDPGSRYGNTNVITWEDRRHGAANGNPPPPRPPQTPDGVVGTSGVPGSGGQPGIAAPKPNPFKESLGKLVVLALGVEVQNNGHLVIDWGGQDGGDGGRGQNAGRGGRGLKGSSGEDESWPGSGCETSTGDGQTGATGGTGGPGGPGGKGGDGGITVVISTPLNLGPGGVFQGSNLTFVNDGGLGGKGGKGGLHGDGGPGGPPGNKSSECAAGNPGADGISGDDGADMVPTGGAGAGGRVVREQVERGTCADMIPRPMVFDPIAPAIKVCRCFSGSGSGDISITGQHLDQVDTVSTSIAGVTVTKKASSTDTQLDLKIQISAASATGVGNLIFKPVLGPNQTLAGAIDIEKCQVTAIAPNSGARGTTVSVTITGQCFDVTGTVHDVAVSGLGVDALNVAVVDDQTMTCQIQMSGTTAVGARDITVKAGSGLSPCQHTLVNGFTIT